MRCRHATSLRVLPPPRRYVPTATHATLAGNAVPDVATGNARDAGVAPSCYALSPSLEKAATTLESYATTLIVACAGMREWNTERC